MTQAKKQLFLLMGPSGGGKTTLGNELKKMGLKEVVSHTTRPMREGEVESVTYYYVDDKTFNQLEMAERVVYAGTQYGVSVTELHRCWEEYDQLFCIVEKGGMEQMKKMFPEAIVIFVYVPLEEMARRMKERGDTKENIARRLEHAVETKELDNSQYADHVILNMELEQSIEQLKAIVNF